MNLHEYQGKQLFAEYGLPVSKGFAVDTPEEAAEACDKIGGSEWVVKAQVHAGGRGKAGGVKLVKSKEDAKAFAQQWLGKNLVTYQTDANGQPVSKILVESCTDIDKELYLGAVVDRSSRRIVFMASTEGGVDIEKVAHDTPEKILKATIDPLVGAQPYQGEAHAQKWELNYVALEGNIGCMVNGAGLAMGTMDIVNLHGGKPANFLDVGGGATKERVTEAFKIILSDSNVKAVLVNIFGGIVRCDMIAEGIIGAVKEVGVKVPVVVRLEGNNAELGAKVLAESGLNIIAATSLTDAAQQVVKAAEGK